ncbi:MAG: hypothetical protein KKC19_02710 [Nanoarchaeota archaeon]|nr:hypothetical protein [Nanoarchaeota archaeon]
MIKSGWTRLALSSLVIIFSLILVNAFATPALTLGSFGFMIIIVVFLALIGLLLLKINEGKDFKLSENKLSIWIIAITVYALFSIWAKWFFAIPLVSPIPDLNFWRDALVSLVVLGIGYFFFRKINSNLPKK